MKSKAESAWELVRRGLVLLLEHFPVFLRTAALLLVPYFVVVVFETLLFVVVVQFDGYDSLARLVLAVLGPVNWAAFLIGTIFARGITTLLIAQILLAPLRKVRAELVYSRLRRLLIPALQATALLGVFMVLPASIGVRLLLDGVSVLQSTATKIYGFEAVSGGAIGSIILGSAVILLTYVVACDLMQLANAVLAEELPIREAIRRSRELRRRAPVDTLVVGLFVLGLPIIPSVVELWMRGGEEGSVGVVVFLAVFIAVFRLITITVNAVLVATLYIKERQTAGESVDDVLACQYVSEPPPKTLWQQRLHVSLESLRSASGSSHHSGARSGAKSPESKG